MPILIAFRAFNVQKSQIKLWQLQMKRRCGGIEIHRGNSTSTGVSGDVNSSSRSRSSDGFNLSNSNPIDLTFEHFIWRSKVIALYRRACRLAFKSQEPQRSELVSWFRQEVEIHKGERDLGKIQYLYATGLCQVQQAENFASI